jgi:Heparinase II/III-like protein
MAAFLLAISNRAGDFPMFGDGDSGQAVSLPETTAERFRALVGIGRLREGTASPDLRSVLLLWGQTPKQIPLSPVQSPKRNLQVFPDGGYYVLAADHDGENEIVIVFDMGPLGFPPLNAHGHADALSFWLSYGGREFLIDPGTYCYQSSPLWRSYFRGTAAHNTIRIDGKDQSVPAGTFLWREAADCRIENLEDTDEFVDARGSHDGYRRLTDPVIHTRGLRLFKKSRTLIITDRLHCQGTHDVELFFHFSEACGVQQVGPSVLAATNGNKRIGVRLDARLNPELYHGCEKPIFGWVSRTFGVKEPSFTLVARTRISGSTEFLTEIAGM